MREELLGALDGITPRQGTVPMISGATGELVDGSELGAGYWYAGPALAGGLRAGRPHAGRGRRTGCSSRSPPHPVLATSAVPPRPSKMRCGVPQEVRRRARAGAPGGDVGTLRRGDGGPARLLASLAQGARARGDRGLERRCWAASRHGWSCRHVRVPAAPVLAAPGRGRRRARGRAGSGWPPAAGRGRGGWPGARAWGADAGRLSLAAQPWPGRSRGRRGSRAAARHRVRRAGRSGRAAHRVQGRWRNSTLQRRRCQYPLTAGSSYK